MGSYEVYLLAYQIYTLCFLINKRIIIRRIKDGNDMVSYCLAMQISAAGTHF